MRNRYSRYHLSRPIKLSLSIWLMIAVLGHFTLGLLGQASYVLCIEANGHAQIESAGYDGQQWLSHCLNQTVDGKAIPNDSELPCQDIPLDVGDNGLHFPALKIWKNFIDLGSIATNLFFFILVIFRKSTVARFPPQNLLPDSRIVQRRSTVLLI